MKNKKIICTILGASFAGGTIVYLALKKRKKNNIQNRIKDKIKNIHTKKIILLKKINKNLENLIKRIENK